MKKGHRWPHYVDLKGLTLDQVIEVAKGKRLALSSITVTHTGKVESAEITCSKGHESKAGIVNSGKPAFLSHKSMSCVACAEMRRPKL